MSRCRCLATAVVLLCPLLLAGCIDRVPDAQQARSYSDGVMVDSGAIRVLNVLVVAPEDGGDGVVSMTIANRGDSGDRLTDIQTGDGDVELAEGELPAGSSVQVGGGDDKISATIRNLQKRPGESVTLKLIFGEAEPITVETVVVPATGEYATITPTPAETPTPEESPMPVDASPSPEAS